MIQPYDYKINEDKMTRAYENDGILVNSGEFDGMENRKAINAITEKLSKIGYGYSTINYKIRDWGISRQRYWGCPIPIILCENKSCGHNGIVPVPYEDLPVVLPKDVKFTGKGNPLETSEEFMNTICPNCGKPAKRVTDTMDTFVDSSWYFFGFCRNKPYSKKIPYRKKVVNYWGSKKEKTLVDQYIGGIEHFYYRLANRIEG